MEIWGLTHTGVVRQQNQDSVYFESLSPQTHLAVVCDGMGGAAAGNVASELAIVNFVDFMKEAIAEGKRDIKSMLRAAVEAANQAVLSRAHSDSACAGMGTTLVAVLVMEDKAYLANVGDSRAYYITRNEIIRVTRDHSLVEDLVQRGEITQQQARVHPQKNLITRALGAEEIIDTDIFEVSIRANDALLLCSDGLSNVLENQEILQIVSRESSAKERCEYMVQTVCSRGAPDNVTVVLLQNGGQAE